MRSSLSVVAVSIVALGTLLAAQAVPVQVGPRDTPPGAQLPAERRFPVGTSSISGTVFAADTGRPVANARVTVGGQVTITGAAAAAAPASRGGPLPVGVAGRGAGGGVPGGVPGGVAQVSGVARAVVTDSSGQFAFPRLPAGQYTISIFQSQFLQAAYGQRRPGGQGALIALADGQQLTLKVPLMRGAVITGMVVGPGGEPQRNAQVRGWRQDMSSGFRRLQSTGFAQSDDRGIYRMFGLQPGDYVISATPNPSDLFNVNPGSQADLVEQAIASGRLIPPTAPGLPPTVSVPIPAPQAQAQFAAQPSYLPTYAPNSMVPSGATMVTIAAGEERAGVDVLVQLTLASTVQGVISTPLDTGVTVQISLVSDDATIDSPPTMSSRPDNTGRFIFRTVPPGKYTVFAQTLAAPNVTVVNGQVVQPQPPQPVLTDAQKMWGRAQVSVAGEPMIDVSLALQPSRSISGIVTFDMAQPPDLSRARISVTVNPAPSPQQVFFGSQLIAQVGPDGRFTVTGVPPGRYMIRSGGGLMKSCVVAGEDTLDFPLEFTGEHDVTDAVLTLTDQSSELTGTLTDSTGKPAIDYMILVVTTDNRFWGPASRRVTLTRPGVDGRYTVRSLPPGTYSVAAVVDLDPGAQYDPAFLRTVARAAVPVTIGEGSKVTQDLRVK